LRIEAWIWRAKWCQTFFSLTKAKSLSAGGVMVKFTQYRLGKQLSPRQLASAMRREPIMSRIKSIFPKADW
jgi:hypothetical protein